MKGHLFVKGNQTTKIKKKVERLEKGLEINCKKHGDHFRWRMHTGNNVQCLFCAAEWQMNKRKRNPLLFIFRDAKKHAEKKNRIFDISLEDLEILKIKQENRCALSGTEFTEEYLPSLDRINSSEGYIKENIQLILIKINRMKSDLDQTEFIDMCIKINTYSEARRGKKK